MAGKFHNELDELKEEVLKMGYHAIEMLSSSVEALKNRDKLIHITSFSSIYEVMLWSLSTIVMSH